MTYNLKYTAAEQIRLAAFLNKYEELKLHREGLRINREGLRINREGLRIKNTRRKMVFQAFWFCRNSLLRQNTPKSFTSCTYLTLTL